MKKSKITVSAPGKLMLLGEHAVVYNRPCIVTAVDSRIKVTAETREDGLLVINAPQLQDKPYQRAIGELGSNAEKVPKEVVFVKRTVELFAQDNDVQSGLTISTKSDFSHRYGFGSSSAVTVGTFRALCELHQNACTEREIFDQAYRVTLDIQGVGSGFDIAAAVYGGTLYFVTSGKKIEKITDKQLPLVVGYTGVKADTPTLVRKVAELKEQKPEMVEEIFNTMADLVEKGKKYIKKKDWQSSGDLLRINHGLLRQLGVSTEKLDAMCTAALSTGAYGAKLSGAGGGDCMITLVAGDKKKAVEKAVESVRGEVIPVITSAEGVRVEK